MPDFRKTLKKLTGLLVAKAQSDRPATGSGASHNYHRHNYLTSVWQKRPPFSLTWADLMTFDQQVWFGLNVGNSPLLSAEVEVEADNPLVAKFVGEQWDRLWSTSASQLLRAKCYGYMAYESIFRICEGRYEFDRLIDRHPIDTRPLVIKESGKLVGVSFRNLPQATNGIRRLWGPQALWLTYGAEHDSLFGTAILERAFGAWYEKTMESGAVRMRQLRMVKDAWIGDVIYYEEDESFETPAGLTISAKDVAMETVENRYSGGAMVFPKRTDSMGVVTKILEYTGPTAVAGATQILEWIKELDWDIFDGLLLPREVVEAATSGSGFSGRSIPFLTFLATRDEEFSAIVRQIDQQLMQPLVATNFGADAAQAYEMKPKPLLETVGKQMGPMGKPDTMEGTDGQPGQQPGRFGQQGNGQPQQLRGPMQFSQFDESEHPRDDDGKFADKSGGKQTITTPDGITYTRAPKGGAKSPVNDKHYKGGWWMPIHGQSDKAKGGKGKGTPRTFKASVPHPDDPNRTMYADVPEGMRAISSLVAGHPVKSLEMHQKQGWWPRAYDDWNLTPAILEDLANKWKAGEGFVPEDYVVNWDKYQQGDDDEFSLTNEPAKKKPAKFDDSDRTKQRKLLDGMDALPGQMDLFQFATDTADARWITIGGRQKGDAKHAGGFPVQISADGTILKSGGLQSIVGKKISGLKRHFNALKKKREKELTSFDVSEFEPKKRTLNRESKVGSFIADAAERHGIDEGDLADAVDYVWKEKRDAIIERENAKRGARELTGLTRGKINKWEDDGHDYSSWPSLDATAREVAGTFPELGLGRGFEGGANHDKTDYAARVWELLKEGKLEPPVKHDPELIDEAAGLVLSSRVDDDAIAEWEPMQFATVDDAPPQRKELLTAQARAAAAALHSHIGRRLDTLLGSKKNSIAQP